MRLVKTQGRDGKKARRMLSELELQRRAEYGAHDAGGATHCGRRAQGRG